MRYHLFHKFFGKMVKVKETSFLSTRGMILIFGNCIGISAELGRIQAYSVKLFSWWILWNEI